MYSLIKETDATVNIELKTTELPYPELPEKLIKMEREYSMEKRVIYSSFNHSSLVMLKQIKPSAKIGLLYSRGIAEPWVYAKNISACAIHPNYTVIIAQPRTVARCHENGVAVNVWTVDSSKIMSYMFRRGVDAVITNRPDVAFACRKKINGTR